MPEDTTQQETPEEIQAQTKAKLREAVRLREAKKEAAFVDDYIDSLNAKAATSDSPEQSNVRNVLALVAPAPEGRVPAMSAARTQLADLADWRYKTLPAWQRDFRNADSDFLVGQCLRGIGMAHRDSGRALGEARELMGNMRAGDITIGDVTSGVFAGTVGDAVAMPVSNYIQAALYVTARVRGMIRVFDAPDGTESLRIPTQSAVSTSTSEPEGDEIAAGEPAIATHVAMQLQKQAMIAVLSNESIEAGGSFGLIQWLINDVTAQMAQREDVLMYGTGAGAGSDQPRGLEVSVSPSGTSPAYQAGTVTQVADFDATTLLDYVHIVKMFYFLPEYTRRNAVWSGPDAVMQALSMMLDGNGRPIFLQASEPGGTVGDAGASGTVGSIMGRPVFNLPGANVALGAASDGDDNRLYFWDPMRTLAMLDRPSVRIEASRDVQFISDETVYKFVRRYDSAIIGNLSGAGKWDYCFTGGIDGAGDSAA